MYHYYFICIVLLMSACTGCQKKTAGKAPEGAVAATSDNRGYERLIAGKAVDGNRASEARAWLDPKNDKNVLWKTTRAETMQFVDDLYEAGAVKVYTVYMSLEEGAVPVNICAELLIVLPTDAALRKKVIRTYNRIDKQIWGPDHETLKDDGRKYLELSMDS